MMGQQKSAIGADRDKFLRQVVVHHRRGDFYPDPLTVGRELQFTPGQTEAVLADLRACGWIAASPWGPERLRLTPRCWNLLQRRAEMPTADDFAANEDGGPHIWDPASDRVVVRASGQFPAVAAPADGQLVGSDM